MLYVDCWKYDGVLFREEAAPLEAENLLQIVNENSNWNGRLNEAYNMLESCIYQIGDRYANYESLTEQYKEGDSNFFLLLFRFKEWKSCYKSGGALGRKIILMMLLKVFVRWENMS